VPVSTDVIFLWTERRNPSASEVDTVDDGRNIEGGMRVFWVEHITFVFLFIILIFIQYRC
jgi:hypothetical protein